MVLWYYGGGGGVYVCFLGVLVAIVFANFPAVNAGKEQSTM